MTVNFLWFGIIIFYLRHHFITRSVTEGVLVHRTTFIDINYLPPMKDIQNRPHAFFCTLGTDSSPTATNDKETTAMLPAFEKGATILELMT